MAAAHPPCVLIHQVLGSLKHSSSTVRRAPTPRSPSATLAMPPHGVSRARALALAWIALLASAVAAQGPNNDVAARWGREVGRGGRVATAARRPPTRSGCRPGAQQSSNRGSDPNSQS